GSEQQKDGPQSKYQPSFQQPNLEQLDQNHDIPKSQAEQQSFTSPVVAFSPDGGQLASGSGDRTVRLWDPKTGKALQTLEGHKKSVLAVVFSPDGGQLASGSGDRTVRLWDPKTGKALQTLEGHIDWVNSVAFSPDG